MNNECLMADCHNPQEHFCLTHCLEVYVGGAYVSMDIVLDAFPDSWLDSLLTGPDAVIGKGPWGCPDIERLLAAIKKRIVGTQAANSAVSAGTTQQDS